MIVADTHLHLYHSYNLAFAMRECVLHLSSLAPEAVCAGFLSERSDCHLYRELSDAGGALSIDDVTVKPVAGCLEVQCFNAPSLYLMPGRQLVTAERLELLCLCVDADIPDGLPAETAVHRIHEVGGVAVLTWAVGKWLFGRAAVVQSLLDKFSASELLVGDSAMRPVFWPTPGPMRAAVNSGYRIIAGTDPLPAAGEESVMGSYASLMDAEFNSQDPAKSLRSALTDADAMLSSVGRRSGAIEFVRRMGHA